MCKRIFFIGFFWLFFCSSHAQPFTFNSSGGNTRAAQPSTVSPSTIAQGIQQQTTQVQSQLQQQAAQYYSKNIITPPPAPIINSAPTSTETSTPAATTTPAPAETTEQYPQIQSAEPATPKTPNTEQTAPPPAASQPASSSGYYSGFGTGKNQPAGNSNTSNKGSGWNIKY